VLVEVILELGIIVELLTQQFTASSRVGIKIHQDQFILAFGFGHGLVQRALELDLGRSRRDEPKQQ
ncbi:MAG: hypothetical protein ACXW3H_05840, partial [Candidatus Aminicenantales bacterium]